MPIASAEDSDDSLQNRFGAQWAAVEPRLRDDLKRRLLPSIGASASDVIDDALQETFAKLLKSRAYIRIGQMDGGRFAYLCRCCRNTLIDLLTKRSRRQRPARNIHAGHPLGGGGFPVRALRSHRRPSNTGEERRRIIRIKRAFDHIRSLLSEQEFSVFCLRFVRGLDAAQVAVILGTTPNNVYQIAWRVAKKVEAVHFVG